MSLKSLAENVISRNQQRNSDATRSELPCNNAQDNSASELRSTANGAAIAPTELTLADERAIIGWMQIIGEDDHVIFRETLDKCRANPDALQFFLALARGEDIGKVH